MKIDQKAAQWLNRTHGVLFFPRITETVAVTHPKRHEDRTTIQKLLATRTPEEG